MKKLWLVAVLLLTGCAGLGATAPDYAVGTYSGAVVGRGSCAFPAAELTVRIAKSSAYGDWYNEQQNIRVQFTNGWVYSNGFLGERRASLGGIEYVGGYFASGGSALDVRIDTGSCSYRGSIGRT